LMDWKTCATDVSPHRSAMSGLAGLGNFSNPIVTSLNGPPGRSRAQISIDDLRKTELPELLRDCVRDFRFWHFSDLTGRTDEVRLWGQSRPRRCGRRLPKMTHNGHPAGRSSMSYVLNWSCRIPYRRQHRF